MPDRLNQVVSSEPSLGTPHAHYEKVITDGSLGAATTYDINCPNLPTGVKSITISGYFTCNTTGGCIVTENTAGNSYRYDFVQAAGNQGGLGCDVVVNADKKVRLVTGVGSYTGINTWITQYHI